MSTPTTISITQTSSDDREEHQHITYNVTINNFTIQTVVTGSASVASTWLRETNASTINNRSDIVVGFDLKIRPESIDYVFVQNPVAIILICVDNRCLMYRLDDQRGVINDDLKNFIAEESGYTLIGEHMKANARDLVSKYNLNLETIRMELSVMAAAVTNDDSVRGVSVREVAQVVLNMEIYQALSIEDHDWDREILSMVQVKNAVLDVYLCYKIGMFLEAYDYEPIYDSYTTTSSDE